MQCTIHGEPLEAVDHHKLLGVELSSDLKEQAYLFLVRPQLEYADVAHGIRTFQKRKNTLRVRRDDKHVFKKMNVAQLLELLRKF